MLVEAMPQVLQTCTGRPRTIPGRPADYFRSGSGRPILRRSLGCQQMSVQVSHTEGISAELARDRESELATTEIQNRLASQFGIPGCRSMRLRQSTLS